MDDQAIAIPARCMVKEAIRTVKSVGM